VTRLQYEAHRFAIEYHKNLRSKGQVHSVLDEIKGVGPARRKALLRHYQDIGKIREASVEELGSIEGITEQVAREIYAFFHKNQQAATDLRDGVPDPSNMKAIKSEPDMLE
jgi:excinuclease ABC subunit C